MTRTIWIGVIGGVLLLLALLLNWISNTGVEPLAETGQTSETPTPPPKALERPEQAFAPATESETAPQSGFGSQPDAPLPAKTGAPPATQPARGTAPDSALEKKRVALVEPTFDVVRIGPNGDAVIAGRANAGAAVTILDDGADLGRAEADGRGEWVYLPSNPLAPGPHELKLKADLPDGRTVFGGSTVVLVVPKPGKDIAGRETDAPAAQQPLAVLIPDETKPGAEVVQAPPTAPDAEPASDTPGTGAQTGVRIATAEPEGVQPVDRSLRVTTIDYDSAGNVSIAGKGPKGTIVLAYLDNALVGAARVRDGGSWRINPKGKIESGVYTLRLDAVRSQAVIARLELPFNLAAPLANLRDDDFIVVQPGNSLWRIARRTLGSGYAYTVIYEANKDQIADPDLIYPGQVFEIPQR